LETKDAFMRFADSRRNYNVLAVTLTSSRP